jgi:hypothetical protein
MKKLFIIVAVLLMTNNLFAQSYVADKGAVMFSGSASFSSSGGSLYEGTGNSRVTSVSILPSFDFFVYPNIFVGGTLQYTGSKDNSNSMHTFAIGPTAGYMVGKPESNIFPYASAGILFSGERTKPVGAVSTSSAGTEFVAEAGAILPIYKHLGIDVGLQYQYQKFDVVSGNIIALKIGITGLLFK